MSTTAALTLSALSALAPAPQAEPGRPAPTFALEDLDGKTWSLEAARGRVVVLEWTSALCPAADRLQRSRIPHDARAALGDGVLWVQIDSSWFGPELADVARTWRAQLALDVPYLLDPDGEVARRYGASVTPELFVVDAAGTLVYAGAMSGGGFGAERTNEVLAAVRASTAGRTVAPRRTKARGCSVKLGPAKGSATDWDEDRDARAIYAAAAQHAREGNAEPALRCLRRAVEARHPAPWQFLADASFRRLLEDQDARRGLRAFLDEHAPRGELTMVAPDEPGTPFVLAGTVRDPDGRPVEGARVRLYHTADDGYYSETTTDARNPRLFGAVLTDHRGRYRIRTILPAYYADTDDDGGLQHIHFGAEASGFRPHTGHSASIYFADDPYLKGEWLAEIVSDGCSILPRTRNAEDVVLCVNDVVLERGG